MKQENETYLCIDDSTIVHRDRVRFTAYRLVHNWIVDYVPAGNGVRLPACVICEIHNRWPSIDGNYDGLKHKITW